MPDAQGRFKGIVVTKVWPGHPDYEEPESKLEPPRESAPVSDGPILDP